MSTLLTLTSVILNQNNIGAYYWLTWNGHPYSERHIQQFFHWNHESTCPWRGRNVHVQSQFHIPEMLGERLLKEEPCWWAISIVCHLPSEWGRLPRVQWVRERDAESARIQHTMIQTILLFATRNILNVEIWEDKCVRIKEITDLGWEYWTDSQVVGCRQLLLITHLSIFSTDNQPQSNQRKGIWKEQHRLI